MMEVGLIAEYQLDPKYFIVVNSDSRPSLNSETVIQLKDLLYIDIFIFFLTFKS